MAAFAATVLLKPRIGRFNKDGSANEILGHNQVFGALSVLLLWVGWFGFNAGSALGVGDGFFGYVAFNTQLGAAGGAVAAMLISWLVNGKADITTTLNGASGRSRCDYCILCICRSLGCCCHRSCSWRACILQREFFEKIKIDDPIYALSVHGAAGVWGTLANGIFATDALAEEA